MRIPSLQSLRALDAADRLGSYTAAAAELGLTHGAVSHRIRALEVELGQPLFIREGNGMQSTPEARRLLVPVRRALDLLNAAFPGHAAASRQLKVSLLPSMASRWLVPRLGQFRTAHPDIELRIDARLEFAQLGAGGVDCAIRYGAGDWPGLHVSLLGDELLFPVCAPAYRRQHGIDRPADLQKAVLLRHDHQHWQPWLAAAGLDWPEPQTGPLFSDTNLLLDAAVAGEGIVLARKRIVASELASGRLVRLFDTELTDRHRYFLVRSHRVEASRRLAVESFAQWLRQQFAADGRSA